MNDYTLKMLLSYDFILKRQTRTQDLGESSLKLPFSESKIFTFFLVCCSTRNAQYHIEIK